MKLRTRRQRARQAAIERINQAGGAAHVNDGRGDLLASLKKLGMCAESVTSLSQWHAALKREQLPFEPNTTTAAIVRRQRQAAKRRGKVKWSGSPPVKPVSSSFATSDAFLSSWDWLTLRYWILRKYGRRCMCCGRTPEDGAKIHVDHIKPRSKFPQLALDEANLQILCGDCNQGKGAWDDTDWRPS